MWPLYTEYYILIKTSTKGQQIMKVWLDSTVREKLDTSVISLKNTWSILKQKTDSYILKTCEYHKIHTKQNMEFNTQTETQW